MSSNNSSSGIQVIPISALDWPDETVATVADVISVQCCGPAYMVYSALARSDTVEDALCLLHNRPRHNPISVDSQQDKSSPSTVPISKNPSSFSRLHSTSSSSHSLLTTTSENESDDTNNHKKNNKPVIDLTTCSPATLNKLTYYEILGNIPIYSTQDTIRKAYYKACLKYHPDKEDSPQDDNKTNKEKEDPVFLKVKEAFDTLSVPAKRKAYDSTSIPFDDSIPSLSDITCDSDFYTYFGKCFERNLRFAQEYNPDLASPSSSSTTTSKNNNKSSTKVSSSSPPLLGNDDTPIEQVYSFYQYWDHFDSWRDFTFMASQELEHDVDMAQDRYEKRYMEKEIKRLASKYKRNEMIRIQKLVERAKNRDPRIVRDKQYKAQEKLQRELQEQERIQEMIKQQEIQQEEERIQQEKVQQEQVQLKKEKELAKYQLRMARSWIRKVMVKGYELEQHNQQQQYEEGKQRSSSRTWSDLTDLNQDIELITSQLQAISLLELSLPMALHPSIDPTLLYPTQDMIDSSIQHMNAISSSHLSQSLQHIKTIASNIRIQQQQQDKSTIHTKKEKQDDDSTIQQLNHTTNKSNTTTTTNKNPWSKEEVSALAKAVKKYPPGCGNRWDSIANFVRNTCRGSTHTRDECIEKFNSIAHQQNQVKNGIGGHCTTTNGSTTSSSTTTNISVESKKKEVIIPSSTMHESKNTATTTTTTTSSTTKNLDWTEEQDQQLQMGLATYPSTMDKNERWTNIASCVKGKSKKECVERFKIIREAIMKSKE